MCPAASLPGCKLAERAALALRNDPTDSKDRLDWKWMKGEATTLANFADPTAATAYKLCIYTGGGAALFGGGQTIIPGSNTLWQPKTAGYKYKDTSAANNGVSAIKIKADPNPSRSSALIKGRGPNLSDPTLNLIAGDFPLVVQLINDDTNFCLESTFLFVDVTRNDATQLKVKNQ